jgi:acyl-CoA synthetase (AMP-forming)/AMP-acid ligase II
MSMAIIDFFDRGYQINPDGPCLIAGGRVYGFREVRAESSRIANALLELGLSKDAKAAVLAGNDPRAWICTLGLWRAGCTWLPANPRSSAEETHDVLDRFDCEVLFFQAAFAPLIEQLRPKLPQVRQYVCIDAALSDAPSVADWVAGQPVTPPDVDPALDDVATLMVTGGTTGRPKGVMLTHRNLQTSLAHILMYATYSGDEQPVNLAAAPMTHTAGIVSLPCTARGGAVVILQRPDPASLLTEIEQRGVTELFLPPTVIYRLLETPDIASRDLSSLEYFFYGAAPMSVEKLKRAIEVFGSVMTQFYGQSEAPGTIAGMRPEDHLVGGQIASHERLSACGRPMPLVRVAILDEQNQAVPNGATGEICARGDLVMKGYYKDPETTAATIVDGWLHTGDVGHLDTEGYLHLTDRKKDMIISGGFNVYPSEVEQVIWTHPAVQDCAVIGVPDPTWGEAVKAVVELNAGATVAAEELIALCKEKLGAVKAPKSVDFLASLPRSPAGKVLKRELRDGYWSGETRRI